MSRKCFVWQTLLLSKVLLQAHTKLLGEGGGGRVLLRFAEDKSLWLYCALSIGEELHFHCLVIGISSS